MNILKSLIWNLKYEITKCRCRGNPAKCDHGKHGLVTSFGEVRDLSGQIVHRNSDPSWQCSGCGFPLMPTAGWKDVSPR
jgi:hypothetical protein